MRPHTPSETFRLHPRGSRHSDLGHGPERPGTHRFHGQRCRAGGSFRKPQNLYNYFKQLFAQVTNPPIDPIREASVMTLMTYIGNHGNILTESPKHAHLVKMQQPILSDEDLGRLRALNLPDFQTETISIAYRPESGLEAALEQVCTEAESAVRSGRNVLILSDRNLSDEEIPIPSLLAASAVNRRLLAAGIRSGSGIILETGEAREVMHFALLLGFGATAVNPYLALETVSELVKEGKVTIDIRIGDRKLHPRDLQRTSEDHVQAGHFHAEKFPQRPAVRGGRTEQNADRPLLLRHRIPRRRHRTGGDCQRGRTPLRHRPGRHLRKALSARLRRTIQIPARRRKPSVDPGNHHPSPAGGPEFRLLEIQGLHPRDQRTSERHLHPARTLQIPQNRTDSAGRGRERGVDCQALCHGGDVLRFNQSRGPYHHRQSHE